MTLRIDFTKFDKKLTEIARKSDGIISDALRETAEQAVKVIVRRTRDKSKDKDGKAFVPYSDSYLNQRKKTGAGSRVILTSSGKTSGGKGRSSPLKGNSQGGQMLNSLSIQRVEDNGHRYVLTVARGIELEKMRAHVRGEGNLPKRNPMGFTQKEEILLQNSARRQILHDIKKIGTR